MTNELSEEIIQKNIYFMRYYTAHDVPFETCQQVCDEKMWFFTCLRHLFVCFDYYGTWGLKIIPIWSIETFNFKRSSRHKPCHKSNYISLTCLDRSSKQYKYRLTTQEPSAVPRDDTLEVGRAADRGSAEKQTRRVLGDGASIWGPKGDLGRSEGGDARCRSFRLSTGASNPRRCKHLLSQRLLDRVLRWTRLALQNSNLLPQSPREHS